MEKVSYLWSTGESIPLIKAKSCCTKIKARRLTTAAKKYLSISDLSKFLEKDKRVVSIQDIANPTSKEEELLAITHRVIEVENEEVMFAKCIAPVDETGMFVRHCTGIDRSSGSSTFYRSVADYNGLILLAFSYEMSEIETKVHFKVTYLDFHTFKVLKHEETITNVTKIKFKFHLMLNCGLFCLVWPFHKCFSVVDFTKTTLEFKQYSIDEDLSEIYVAEISGRYLSLTLNSKTFDDDVFFVSHGSKRDTIYYSLETGLKYSSQKAMQKMSKIMKIENPMDVVFLRVPNKAMWMVTECLPSNMALCSITFFSEVELHEESNLCVKKRLDLTHLISQNQSLFELPNEHQINFELCKINWHVFLWISKRHILQIDLLTLQPSAIIEVETSAYNDFKGEFFNFTMKMSLNRKDLNVFIRDSKSIVHFESFKLHHSVQTLRQIAKFKLADNYPKSFIENLTLQNDLKKDILAAY